MNRIFVHARVITLAVSVLMTGVVSAEPYEQSTPSLPSVTGPNNSKIIPPAPAPPPPAPSMQGSGAMTTPQSDYPSLQQPGIDNNRPMQQDSDMIGQPPSDMNGQPQGGMGGPPPGGAMRAQPPGMSGGRSNAAMSGPSSGAGMQQGGGTMAPPSGARPSSGVGPQSKRTPIKSKAQVSKKQ
jgi:hypothetical protein